MRAVARSLAALVLLVILFVGCELQLADQSSAQTQDAPAAAGDPSQPAPVRIASFNIQVFGTAKLRKRPVMNVLAEVARRFDVLVIQEVRAKDDRVLPTFVEMINATGRHYDFVIGPRLGRTSSKEQYAFVFDTTRIECDRKSMYTVADPQDRFQREPTVARFRVRAAGEGQPFTFALADIHTEPDEAANELNALADVYVGIQNDGSGEDDVILLGDLNADEYHLGRLGQLPGIFHVVTGVTTNTRRTHMYDNLIFDRRRTVEYTGRWGVLDLRNEYQLSLEQALEVSDHFPVWAEFSPYEGGAAVAGRSPASR